jgi:hypothetical protein
MSWTPRVPCHSNTKWCNMNLLSSCNLNSSLVKVSSRSDVSCFFDIHHSHSCSFNRVWTKWIRFLLISRHWVSIYTSTWCNHGHTHLVLVSFPAKKSGSLALMVTLVDPHLGHYLRHPNFPQCSSSAWLSPNFVLWFPLVGPQTQKKHSQEPKILCMNSPPLGLPPPTF